MRFNLHRRIRSTPPPVIFAASLCLLLGLALIFNIQPAGDGMWYWYARFFRNGVHLYGDLHFPLQPLFVLLTAGFQAIVGPTWLASKTLPVLQLCSFCLLTVLISAKASLGHLSRALLIAGVFFCDIASPYYRFDDYHVTSDVLVLLAIYLLLQAARRPRAGDAIELALAVGVSSGLCLTNRINDGSVLLIGCLLALAFIVKQKRILSLVSCVVGAAIGSIAVIYASRDSLLVWFRESVIRAATIKGGSGHIFTTPLLLPWMLLGQLATKRAFALLIYSLIFWGCVQRLKHKPVGHTTERLVRLILLLLALCCSFAFVWQSRNDTPAPIIGMVSALLLYGGGVLVCLRAFAHLTGRCNVVWRSEEALLLIPFGQLLASALTSARTLPDFYPPVAETMLLLPLIYRGFQRTHFFRLMLGICAAITLSVGVAKIYHPYAWHNYGSAPLFRARQWYQHPIYGPMYIESAQLQTFEVTCSNIQMSLAPQSLLSLPYPYANLFCVVPPWHDYVQTWYDTSGAPLINQITKELERGPPEWISYQHDPNIIRIHEKAFHGGEPIPHRLLDRLIISNILANRWTLVQRTCLRGSDWLLIHTIPSPTPSAVQNQFHNQPRGFCGKDYDDLASQTPMTK